MSSTLGVASSSSRCGNCASGCRCGGSGADSPSDGSRRCQQSDEHIFNAHLHTCLKNLEADFEAVRRQRDKLLAENAELRQSQQQQGNVADKLARLTLELQQQRLENSEFRERESRLADENQKLRQDLHAKSDYDQLSEALRQSKDKLTELESQHKHYGELYLRSAQAQSQLSEYKNEVEKLRRDQSRFDEIRNSLQKEVDELRRSHLESTTKLAGLEAENAGYKVHKQAVSELEQECGKLRREAFDKALEIQNMSSKINGQESLIKVLTDQMAGMSGNRGEAERLSRLDEKNRGEIERLRQEIGVLERKNKDMVDEINNINKDKNQLFIDLAGKKSELEGMKRDVDVKGRIIEELKGQVNTLQDIEMQLRQEIKKININNEEKLASLKSGSGSGSGGEVERLTKEKEMMMSKINQLEREKEKGCSRCNNNQLNNNNNNTDKLIETLRKELTIEKLGHKKTSSELQDAKFDREAAVSGYKKLCGRYKVLLEEKGGLQDEVFNLQKELNMCGNIKQTLNDTKNEMEIIMNQLKEARIKILGYEKEMAGKDQEISGLTIKLDELEKGMKRDETNYEERVEQLNNELNMTVRVIKEQEKLIDYLKDKLNQLNNDNNNQLNNNNINNNTVGNMAQGRRCPCKSRPPPPPRWQR